MRVVLTGLLLLLAACAPPPPEDSADSHVCTTSPAGLVECHEAE